MHTFGSWSGFLIPDSKGQYNVFNVRASTYGHLPGRTYGGLPGRTYGVSYVCVSYVYRDNVFVFTIDINMECKNNTLHVDISFLF